jgi:hypothetical protein
MSKLTRLQEEAEKLRKEIDEREARKRKSLREWDKMTRDVNAAGVRSQLAEDALRSVAGEAEGTAAF